MLDHNHLALIIHTVAFLGGAAGSIFILVVNFMDWLKTRHLTASELLMSSLGLSNVGVQIILAMSIYCYLVSGGIYSLDHVSKPFFILRMFAFSSSLWFATWLCVYCCVKIVHLNQSFLNRLKLNISKMAPWLLLGSVLFSLVLTLPAIWDVTREDATNTTVGVSRNTTMPGFFFQSRCSCIFVIFILGCSVAFIIFLISAVLLITSLCMHVRRMGQNGPRLSNPRMDAHLSAIKIVMSLLLLYIALFVSAVLIISDTVLQGDPCYMVCSIVACAAPALLPIVLILGNARLKRTFTRLFSLWRMMTWRS